MEFAEKLKQLRLAGSLSREELAIKSGLSHGAVRDYEQGRRQPSLESAIKLADALGVSVAVFQASGGAVVGGTASVKVTRAPRPGASRSGRKEK